MKTNTLLNFLDKTFSYEIPKNVEVEDTNKSLARRVKS